MKYKKIIYFIMILINLNLKNLKSYRTEFIKKNLTNKIITEELINKFNLKNEIDEYLSKKIILTIGGVGDINILNIIENIFSLNIDEDQNEIFEIVKNERENFSFCIFNWGIKESICNKIIKNTRILLNKNGVNLISGSYSKSVRKRATENFKLGILKLFEFYKKNEILIIAHSYGGEIAIDAINKINEENKDFFKDKKITLVTMGSPISKSSFKIIKKIFNNSTNNKYISFICESDFIANIDLLNKSCRRVSDVTNEKIFNKNLNRNVFIGYENNNNSIKKISHTCWLKFIFLEDKKYYNSIFKFLFFIENNFEDYKKGINKIIF